MKSNETAKHFYSGLATAIKNLLCRAVEKRGLELGSLFASISLLACEPAHSEQKKDWIKWAYCIPLPSFPGPKTTGLEVLRQE